MSFHTPIRTGAGLSLPKPTDAGLGTHEGGKGLGAHGTVSISGLLSRLCYFLPPGVLDRLWRLALSRLSITKAQPGRSR